LRKFIFYAHSLFQTPGVVEASEEGFGMDVLGLVVRSSLPSQIVLLILVGFSVASWAVIFLKLRQFQTVQRQTTTFIEVFRRSSKFSDVQSVCKSLAQSPLAGVFQAGYAELNAQLRNTEGETNGQRSSSNDPARRPALQSFEALDRTLLRASSMEMAKLERRVPFLATTASITPFIGLLGTVWGIIIAFQGIGETGSTDLAVVAPGIAEALVATAAGLFAAIPAVYFYNHLTQRVGSMFSALDDFSLEFLNIAEKNFS
jgi:biopolymer transport protein TolQ